MQSKTLFLISSVNFLNISEFSNFVWLSYKDWESLRLLSLISFSGSFCCLGNFESSDILLFLTSLFGTFGTFEFFKDLFFKLILLATLAVLLFTLLLLLLLFFFGSSLLSSWLSVISSIFTFFLFSIWLLNLALLFKDWFILFKLFFGRADFVILCFIRDLKLEVSV